MADLFFTEISESGGFGRRIFLFILFLVSIRLVINPIHVELDIKFLDLGETKACLVAVSPFAAILASSPANIMYDVGYISHNLDNPEKLDEQINGDSWNVGRVSFLPSGVLFSDIGICGQKLQY